MKEKLLTKKEMMQQYDDWMNCKGYAESTKRGYRAIVNTFIDFSPKHPYHRTTQDIVQYISTKPSGRSKEQNKWALFWFYKYIFNQPQKVIRIPTPKRKRQHIPEYLTLEEYYTVISNITNLKHRAIIQYIYAGALRISECLNTELAHFDKLNKMVLIRSAKGNKDRMVPIPEETLILLRTYYQKYKPQKYLFEYRGGQYSKTSIRNILARAVQKAGIQKRIVVHTLRHSRATHLIQAGADISFVQKMLGHSSIITTQTTYNHSNIHDMQQVIMAADERIKGKVISINKRIAI